jgi:hypothetical protein
MRTRPEGLRQCVSAAGIDLMFGAQCKICEGRRGVPLVGTWAKTFHPDFCCHTDGVGTYQVQCSSSL